jgi:membrane-associated phospholipid phosphatase
MLKHLRLLCLCLFIPVCARAQSGNCEPTVGDILAKDGATLLDAAAYLAVRPLHWNGSDWLTAGGIGAGTLTTSLADIDVRGVFDRNHTATNDQISDAVVLYGDGRYMFPLGGGIYLAGLLVHDRWLRETGLLATGAMLFSGIFSTATKIAVGRARPFTGHGHFWFQPFRFFNDDVHSFPSGHTVVAFAMSTVLARRINNLWASIGLYGLATFTAASRIYTSEHWFSDLVFGAASAIVISNAFVSWFEREAAGTPCSFSILPTTNGVTFIYTL